MGISRQTLRTTANLYKFTNLQKDSCALKTSIIWDITLCSPLKVNWRFKGTFRLHLQGSSKTSVDFQWITRHYIPEDNTLHNHCCDSSNPTHLCTLFSHMTCNFCNCLSVQDGRLDPSWLLFADKAWNRHEETNQHTLEHRKSASYTWSWCLVCSECKENYRSCVLFR
jgi:hypothetical protein